MRAASVAGATSGAGCTRKKLAVPGERLSALSVARVVKASGVMNPLVPRLSPTIDRRDPR
jgi:hypothetical protein